MISDFLKMILNAVVKTRLHVILYPNEFEQSGQPFNAHFAILAQLLSILCETR